MQCSVLLLTDDGLHLVTWSATVTATRVFAAQSMGFAIGPRPARAAPPRFSASPSSPHDIAPIRAGSRGGISPCARASCLLVHAHLRTGREVLGTFAVYHGEPHEPTESEIALVSEATDFAQIASRSGRANKH